MKRDVEKYFNGIIHFLCISPFDLLLKLNGLGTNPTCSAKKLALCSKSKEYSIRFFLVSFPETPTGYILFVPEVGRNMEAHYLPWINMPGYKSVCKWFLENLCSTCDCLLAKGRMKGKTQFNPSQAPLERPLITSTRSSSDLAFSEVLLAPSLCFPAPDFGWCFPF